MKTFCIRLGACNTLETSVSVVLLPSPQAPCYACCHISHVELVVLGSTGTVGRLYPYAPDVVWGLPRNPCPALFLSDLLCHVVRTCNPAPMHSRTQLGLAPALLQPFAPFDQLVLPIKPCQPSCAVGR